ncbi:bifunctional 3-(3-hydroxy-phenyl)propionate/3-hydroxycinnamic acid hydroxylase [Streptantibioticus ferralitis]|uniref:Bifunctional 3-(3-hydroxy-phenyl)propionate/3-hydroxycinnamic acid hydroxylase n=1 Tax=Streptantibioticus ferralitis TaxID=236510 RepID=A0ABT5YTN7_9ACTN|nr:bifunctional 3-(3-hydroxy-phenyl)propionate/3-hydroxycinnamic acid hydroxylase [Streptantibioticus ferralitis]MDF2254747.1 bifunctional 3-(3-hydroxy-phenyl)propionate/3-hydroxycinnamic acid hydroxylase [Streptantibioticus ferralitis]
MSSAVRRDTARSAVEKNTLDYDVAIVGYGPVGQLAAILLGDRGWRVGVVERHPEPYKLPRAVHFDDEVARILAAAGLVEQIGAISVPAPDYEWRNADGQTLLRFDRQRPGASGWPQSNNFHQPDLEQVLDARVRELAQVDVRRGHEATELLDLGDHAEVTVRDPSGEQYALRAAYVIGCDGANSLVRDRMRTSVTDLGFCYDWLIVDVTPHQAWPPVNLQICDPARPTTVVSGGPGRRRWEFMRMPGETIDDLNRPETAWRLLASWNITPDNATFERHAVYTFQARWADRWRDGRLLLAGDAAHLMPPFAGQGMCSGLRDAANLAWKIDLVLGGTAHPDLLDTYTSERCAHVQHAIGLSIALGKIICATDPEIVAARDQAMLDAGARPESALPKIPPPVLGPGLLHRGPDGWPARPAGHLAAQGRARAPDGRTGLLDDLVGTGFRIAAMADPRPCLSAHQLDFLASIGARLVRIVPADQLRPEAAQEDGLHTIGDVDTFLLPHLKEVDHAAAIVRPDFYLYGAADTLTELPALVDELRSDLTRPTL